MQRYGQSIPQDAPVRARDGTVGTVGDVIVDPATDEVAYLLVRIGWFGERIVVPAEAIDRIEDGEVRLRWKRDEVSNYSGTVPADLVKRVGSGDLRIPLYEERLRPEKRLVDLGELRIDKRVEQIDEVIREPVERDTVDIERVPIDRLVDAPPSPRQEDDWFVFPVLEEVLVVERRLKLREEVRVRVRRVTETGEIHETRRREVVDIDQPGEPQSMAR